MKQEGRFWSWRNPAFGSDHRRSGGGNGRWQVRGAGADGAHAERPPDQAAIAPPSVAVGRNDDRCTINSTPQVRWRFPSPPRHWLPDRPRNLLPGYYVAQVEKGSPAATDPCSRTFQQKLVLVKANASTGFR